MESETRYEGTFMGNNVHNVFIATFFTGLTLQLIYKKWMYTIVLSVLAGVLTFCVSWVLFRHKYP